MVFMIESQIAYVLDCLRAMERARRRRRRGAPGGAGAPTTPRSSGGCEGTVWLSGCASWYLDASGRNTTLWPGFTFRFRRRTRRFDAAQYELRPARVPTPVSAGGG